MAEEEKKNGLDALRKKGRLLPEQQFKNLLHDAGPSVLSDLRKTMTALNLRIEGIRMRIELYETMVSEQQFNLRPDSRHANKIKASIKGLKIIQRNYMELKARIYQSVDEILSDHDSDYRKLFRAFFIDGVSKEEIARQANTNKSVVQARIYSMYSDFYDNDGINPGVRKNSLKRRKMQARAEEARVWKASHSQSTGK